jgi:hypothetical protein
VPRLIGEIAYLDKEAVRELLEVVDGGLLLTFNRHAERSRAGSSSLRAVFGGSSVEGSRARSASDSLASDYSSSSVGNLGRLFKLLDERGLVSEVLGSDRLVWDQLEEGEFIECGVRTSIAPFHAFLDDADDLLAKFAGVSSMLTGEQAAQLRALQPQVAAIQGLFSAQSALPVLIQPNDDDGPRRFYAYLSTDPEKSVYRKRAAIGSGVVLGRVRRILRDRESVDFLQIGNYSLPRENVRKLLVGLQNNPLGKPVKLSDLKATAPAIELQVLAIVA